MEKKNLIQKLCTTFSKKTSKGLKPKAQNTQRPRYTHRMEEEDIGVFTALTPLEEWAAQVHEIYLATIKAGFDQQDALTLISNICGYNEN